MIKLPYKVRAKVLKLTKYEDQDINNIFNGIQSAINLYKKDKSSAQLAIERIKVRIKQFEEIYRENVPLPTRETFLNYIKE